MRGAGPRPAFPPGCRGAWRCRLPCRRSVPRPGGLAGREARAKAAERGGRGCSCHLALPGGGGGSPGWSGDPGLPAGGVGHGTAVPGLPSQGSGWSRRFTELH